MAEDRGAMIGFPPVLPDPTLRFSTRLPGNTTCGSTPTTTRQPLLRGSTGGGAGRPRLRGGGGAAGGSTASRQHAPQVARHPGEGRRHRGVELLIGVGVFAVTRAAGLLAGSATRRRGAVSA